MLPCLGIHLKNWRTRWRGWLNQTKRFNYQEFHEARMKKFEVRLMDMKLSVLNQQESLANLEKQMSHIAKYLDEGTSTKIATFKECNNINFPSSEILNSSILQDANNFLLVQEEEKEKPQEVHKEDIPEIQIPTKKIKQVIPYPGRVKHEEERIQLENSGRYGNWWLCAFGKKSFVDTFKALVDVSNGQLKIVLNKEEISLNLIFSLKYPMELDDDFD